MKQNLSLSPPTNLLDFYKCMLKYENAISSEAQLPQWIIRRDEWRREVTGSTFNVAHAATLLLALESNIRSTAQDVTWGILRKLFVLKLFQLGGTEINLDQGQVAVCHQQ